MIHPCQQTALDAHTRLTRTLNALRDAERGGSLIVVSDGLRSPVWGGTGRSIGTHSDPVGGVIVSSVSPWLAVRRRWTLDTLAWLAGRLGLAGEPLGAIAYAIPKLRPTVCEQLTLWLNDLDERVRRTLTGEGE